MAVDISMPRTAVSGVDESSASLETLTAFCQELYACLTARADALFELCDAVRLNLPALRTVSCGWRSISRRGPARMLSARRSGCTATGRAAVTVVRQTMPGWPYSVAVALGSGRSSWTAPLDILRLGPGDDLTDITATQIRELIDRLRQAGQLHAEDPAVLIVLDSGYDLSWLLAGRPRCSGGCVQIG